MVSVTSKCSCPGSLFMACSALQLLRPSRAPTPERNQDLPAARGQDQPPPLPSSPGALVTLYQRKLCAGHLSRPVRYGDFFLSCVFYGFWGATGKRNKSTLHACYVIFKRWQVSQLHLISFSVTNSTALCCKLFPLSNFTFRALIKKIQVSKHFSM